MSLNYNKDLSKKEIQAAWDYALLSGAKHGVKMYRVFYDFMNAIGSNAADLYGLSYKKYYEPEFQDFFDGLELNRCRDRQRDGSLSCKFKMNDALSFVGARCLPLQLALLDKRVDLDDIVSNVRHYKWVRKNHTGKKTKKRTNDSYRYVNLKSLTFKNQWSTVK